MPAQRCSSSVGVFLYNRWKGEAVGNLRALREYLQNHEDTRQILRVADISNPRAFIADIAKDGEMADAAARPLHLRR